jgi:hypothetical protein
MSTLEVLSYLTDSTFTSVVALVLFGFAGLTVVNRIGGPK